MSEVCYIDSDNIVNGGGLMAGNMDLEEWNSSLSKLVVGDEMFAECIMLNNFVSNLNSLKSGIAMFLYNIYLNSFDIDLPSLEDGSGMFFGCPLNANSVIKILQSIPSLDDTEVESYIHITVADEDMPLICEHLHISGNATIPSFINAMNNISIYPLIGFPVLYKGWGVVLTSYMEDYNIGNVSIPVMPNYGTTPYDVSEATGYIPDASLWFEYTSPKKDIISVIGERAFTTIEPSQDTFVCNIETSKIVTGGSSEDTRGLFCLDGNISSDETSPLELFQSDLSNLIDGSYMFAVCSNLHTFISNLNSLENGYCMFGATGLKSFDINMPSLLNGMAMFMLSAIESFSSDISSLEDGTGMFYLSYRLETFTSDLSSLTSGLLMFGGCILDKPSVINIITCLKERNILTSSGTIALGINASLKTDTELQSLLGITEGAEKTSILAHGGGTWTVTIEWNEKQDSN